MTLISTSGASKIWSYLLKVAPFFKRIFKNNYLVFKAMKQSGSADLENDETSIYFHTLYELSSKWHPDIESLFAKRSIKQTILKNVNMQTGAVDAIVQDIQATLYADIKFDSIRSAQNNWEQIASEFLEAYENNVVKTATPVQKLQLRYVSSQLSVPEKSMDLSGLISDYAELRKSNKHRTVIELLSKIKSEKWQHLSKEQQYNVVLNLAVTYHELKEDALAAQHFLELLDFQLKLEETYSYVALAYAILKDFSQAQLYAEKSLAINPSNINAYLAQILARTPLASSNEIKQIVPHSLQENPTIQVNIALSLDREGRHEEAISILTKTAEQHPTMDIFRGELLNSLGASHIESLGFHRLPPPYELKENDRVLITTVRKMFAEAWDFYKNTDLQNSRVYILTNLGTTNSLLGDAQDAISDMTAAFKLSPSFAILLNLWVLYKDDLKNRRWVTQQADQLSLSDEQKVLLLEMKTEVAYEDGTFNTLLVEATGFLHNVINPNTQRDIEILIIEYNFQLGKNDEAQVLTDKFLERWPADKMGYFFKARLADMASDPAEVRYWIELALSVEEMNEGDPFLSRAMQILYKLRQYDLIIKTLKDKPIDRYVPSLNYLLLAQLESGNHAEAASLAEHWHRLYPSNPRFVDILGSIQIETGLYHTAIQTFNRYLEDYPNDRIIRLKLGTAYYKSLQFEESIKIFDGISDYTGLPPHVGFQAADAYCKAGEQSKGYDLAYEIRRQNYQKIEAHQEYIRVLTASPLDEQTPIQLNEVTLDTAVTISDTLGVLQTFVIVEHPVLTDEVKPGDLLSHQLINKKIGEEISIPSQKFTITNIISKHTHAYQDSIKQLGSRFANQGNIKVGNFREGADPIAVIKELISLTSGQSEKAEQPAPDISPNSLPMCMRAIRRGQTAVAFWYDLTDPNAVGIDSQMLGESFDWAIEQIRDQTLPILFDVTSLLAMRAIGALNNVVNIKKRIWVTESTMHLIQAEVFTLKNLPKNIPSIAEVEFPISEQSRIQEARSARINELESLLAWIKANVTIVYPKLSNNFNEDSHIITAIGRSYFDIRQISTENSVLLVTDDRNYRMWCNQEGAKGISTIALLQGIEKNSGISEIQLQAYYISMLKIHYLLVPVDGQALIELLIETGFAVGFPFSHATLWIADPFSNVETASTIVVDFLYKLYQETTLIETRKNAIQFILKRFAGGRTFEQLSEVFMPNLKARFSMMPSQLREIHQFLVQMR